MIFNLEIKKNGRRF